MADNICVFTRITLSVIGNFKSLLIFVAFTDIDGSTSITLAYCIRSIAQRVELGLFLNFIN
ncbi:MAG: hypothetical protein KAW56_04735, partial [Candidatus Marinimicrobia bacterium]|nr:hypothetical protein [Candidatus Neomarinimicrobiota bacterium]